MEATQTVYPWIELGLNAILLITVFPAFIILIQKYLHLTQKPPKLLFYPALFFFIITILTYIELVIITMIEIIGIYSEDDNTSNVNLNEDSSFIVYLSYIFIVSYSMQNYLLILSLYTRLYCIFSSTTVQLTKCCHNTFIIILTITPFISLLHSITPYLQIHINQYTIISIIAISELYHISLTMILIILFLYKLHKIYKNKDNKFLLQITTKTTILAVLSIIFSIISTITYIISVSVFFENIAVFINIYTNFLYVALSFEFFHTFYSKTCGVIDSFCKICLKYLLKIDPNKSSPPTIDIYTITRKISESLDIKGPDINIKENKENIDRARKLTSIYEEKIDNTESIQFMDLPTMPNIIKFQPLSSNSRTSSGHTMELKETEIVSPVTVDAEMPDLIILEPTKLKTSTSLSIQPTPIQIIEEETAEVIQPTTTTKSGGSVNNLSISTPHTGYGSSTPYTPYTPFTPNSSDTISTAHTPQSPETVINTEIKSEINNDVNTREQETNDIK